VLTCSTLAEDFPRYEPIFNDAAKSTRGIVAPKSLFTGVGVSALTFGLIGAVIGGIKALTGKKKA
jgi:hypothetical protein